MRTRWFVAALTALLLAPGSTLAQDETKIFPLSEVKAGLKGTGLTVFEGDQITPFQVEILGVLKNAIAPKQDVILARLSGGPLADTGVIAGMSGSPVYIDGKLVGAVALAFPFSKAPLAGITPIEQMLKVVPEAACAGCAIAADRGADKRAARAENARVGGRLEAGATGDAEPAGAERVSTGGAGTLDLVTGPNLAISTSGAGWGYDLVQSADGLRLLPKGNAPDWTKVAAAFTPGSGSPLSLPIRFGGFSSQVVDSYTPLFRSLGFEPMSGGILSGSAETAGSGTALPASYSAAGIKPGSMISLFLVSGDFDLNADCTVTYVHGNDLYACGHRLLLAGPSAIPFGRAQVIVTVPSIASSFKLDAPGPPVGVIQQDRFSAIYGVVGAKANSIPVHLKLQSTLNSTSEYNFDVIQDSFLSPLLVNVALVSAFSGTERMVGASTISLDGKIHLSTGDSVSINDVVSSDFNAANGASTSVALPLTYLLGSNFPDLQVKSVDVSAKSLDQLRVASLEQAWASDSVVHPGEKITATAVLRTPWGETVTEKIPIQIPENITDKTLSLVVGSGMTINMLEGRLGALAGPPRNVHQLVEALNHMRHSNQVYALLMAPQRSFVLQGKDYPSPPPSLLQTLMADPAASSGLSFRGTSVVGDFEGKPSPYAIQGQKTLYLKVLSGGTPNE